MLSPFWTQLPEWDDIIGHNQHVDRLPADAPLHVKIVPRIDIQQVRDLPASPETKAAFARVTGWLDDDSFYSSVPECSASEVPFTKMSAADINNLSRHGIIDEIEPRDVRGPVRMFKVPEVAKGRFRPIKHTYLINDILDKSTLPASPMATTRDIVDLVLRGSHFLSLDFSAYYDQFRLCDDVSRRMCFRKGKRYYRVCTLPMGQRQAVPVAATTTAMFLDFPCKRTTTQAVIDNVIFVGTEKDVLSDARKFVRRVHSCNGKLNEDTIELTPLLRTSGEWCGVMLDLTAKTVALTNKVVEKLKVSWSRRTLWTYRNFAAHCGLLFYAWNVLDIPAAEFYPLLRFISECGRVMSLDPERWDDTVYIWPSARSSLERWTAIAIANAPRVVKERGSPDWLVCTDASAYGWGYVALNSSTNEIRSFGAPWNHQHVAYYGEKLKKSTVAEPLAIYNAMCHLLKKSAGPTRVRVGTDNTVAAASYTRGFNAHSFDINECLRRLRATFGPEFSFEFCYIPGEENVADPYSRGKPVSQDDWATTQSLRRLLGTA